MNTSALVRRVVAGATTAVLIAAGAVALSASPATAADELPTPAPVLQRDETVATADPLPTVQIDEGFVWAQTTIGNTVYAAGSFSNARAPLAAPGTNLTPRNNLLAYDITTGALLPFAPNVNGEIRSIAASPDGTRIYIGGSFNSVNGQTRWNFAVLNAATGQLVPGIQPAIGGVGVYGIVATGSTVYLAGLFTQANGVARTNFAAVSASNGALQTWAPTSDLQVDALVLEPGTGRLIAGGRFSQVNGLVQRGLAALDPASGALYEDWQAPDTIKNGWNEGQNAGKAGIFGLATDDTGIYGTGWVFANAATGNLEGTFAADAGTGAVRWVADCHGDHYGVYSNGDVVYTTTHTHQCDTVGLWPEQNPRQYRYVEAYTTDARGLLSRSPSVGSTYANWEGTPSPSAYNWFPDFTVGTASGLGQAGLSVTGAGDYVSVAGEFTSVNNQRYQGIVRFSTSPASGADQGPRLTGADWEPEARSVTPGRVRVSVPVNYDRDDLDLTYDLLRDGRAEPVVSRTEQSRWWDDSDLVFEEKGLTAGSTQTYRVRVTDGDGNSVTSDPVSVTVADGEPSLYADTVLDDGATLYYPMGEIHDDWAGDNPQVRGSGLTDVTPGAVEGSTGAGATAFSGTSSGRITAGDRATPGDEFSVELWLKTDTTRGGKLIGYGNSRTGTSGSHDRHVYMQNSGRLTFGVYPGSAKTISSSASYNDDEWHHVVATQGEAGMALYVDGQIVASDASVTTAQDYTGYWRIGGDNISGWPSSPTSSYFAGEIDEVAVYGSALTAGQVSAHTAAGEGLETPTAAFESAVTDLDVEFDGTGSTADDGRTIVGYEWDFGDGSAVATGATVQHSFAAAGSYEVSLTVTDDRGLTAMVSQEVVVEAPNVDPTAEFTSAVNSLTATFDGSASTDEDGDIAAYEWDFGDGSEPGSGSTVSHVYEADGDYTVTLTVTDDRGGEASTTGDVTVSHEGPTASFESTTSGLGVSVDATASAAADGASLEYSWNWGDDTADSSGVGASHTFAEAGEYTVTLTVTDEFGATGTETQVVTVTAAPAEAVVVSDAFERSVASGWGSADVGGAWSAMWGAASAGSVSGGRGLVSLDAGQTRNFAAEGVAVSDVSASVEFALESAPSSGNAYAGLAARQSASENYTTRAWMRSDGSVWLVVQRSGTVLAAPILNGVSWAAGDVFRMETEVTGANPTTIRSKVWKDGSAEPADWQASVTDSTAGLQDAGWVSTHFARAGSAASAGTIAFDEVSVTDLSAPVTDPGDPDEPVNEDPVASFSSEVADLDVSVDASGSSDADGSVDSYAWSWGDGSADGSGVTASHTYAEAGEYTVTLTVTDDEGAEASSTESVTVTEPVTDPGDPDEPGDTAVVVSDAFERSVASGWGSADVGGAWSAMWGAASAGSVSGGRGLVSLDAGQTRNFAAEGVAVSDVSASVEFALESAPSSGNAYAGLAARQSASENYTTRAWMRSDGSVWLVVQRSGTVLAAPILNGVSWAAGDVFRMETEVTGANPTTIRSKVWKDGSAEPADWQASVTDSTAGLQDAGWVSTHFARAGSAASAGTIAFDEVSVTDLSAPVTDPGDPDEPVNEDPVASFSSEVADLDVSVDASGSSDADGSVDSYAWSWGDGSADGSGVTASHTYAEAGEYTVTLTVTDDEGAEASSTESVTVTAPVTDPGDPDEPVNEDPVASFSSEVADLDVSVDASGSSDADGSVDSYAWSWGDGSADGSGVTASHTYAEAGEYTVTLTVTDDEGAEASSTESVTVTEPVTDPGDPGDAAVVLADAFERSVASGWGTADVGGDWSVRFGSAANASVQAGKGVVTLPALETRNLMLNAAPVRDLDLSVDFSLDAAPATGNAYAGLVARQADSDNYQVRAWLRSDGSIWLVAQRGSTVLDFEILSGLTRAAGDTFTLRMSVTGADPTTISAKLWRTGAEEPADWQLSVTDSTPALQAALPYGVHANRASNATTPGVFTFDEFRGVGIGE